VSDPVTNLHYAPNGNIVNDTYAPGADGFNVADISSAGELPYLPNGVQALAWLGMTGGVTTSFTAAVNSYIGASNLFGIYIADEPDPTSTPAANLKAEADYIHATLPGVKTFMVEQNLGSNTSPVYAYTPTNTDIDLFGLDPYPVQTNVPNNLDYGIIPLAVSVAEADGISLKQIVPIYQAFGGGQYTTYILPTAAQEQQILSTWGTVVPNPVFDYAYSWGVQVGDTALSIDPALQQVFAVHNAGGTSPPPPPNATTVASIATSGTGIDSGGNGDLDAGNSVTLMVNFSGAVTVTNGSPTLALNDGGTATFGGGSGTTALTFNYTVASGQNTPDLTVSSFDLNGAKVLDASSNEADLSGATNDNPAGTLEIDTTAPTIVINTIARNNVVTHGNATSGFAISGTTSDAENGRTVTVDIVNGAHAVVDNYTAMDQSNAWSVNVSSTQALALADGSYTVTANVSDQAGNPAPQASKTLTVDEEQSPEPPILTIANSSLSVSANGGSVALGITATPVDSDDRVSVKVGGVPSYETITAPLGDSVSHQSQGRTSTWTITQSASAAGTPLTGLTLTSHYTGTGHPVANLSVSASDTTSGETATSFSKTIAVTDPPTGTFASSPTVKHVASLFDQFVSAAFVSDKSAGEVVPLHRHGGFEKSAFLSNPHH
jgi:Bacterial Ig-like domain